MGFLGMLTAWFLGGLIYGLIIYILWNILAALFGMVSITFGIAIIIGTIIVIIISNKK